MAKKTTAKATTKATTKATKAKLQKAAPKPGEEARASGESQRQSRSRESPGKTESSAIESSTIEISTESSIAENKTTEVSSCKTGREESSRAACEDLRQESTRYR